MMSRLRYAPATATLLGLIALLFVGESLDPAEVLVTLGGNQALLVLGHGQYWRLLTSMFLHADILHVALNGLALYQLGSLFEGLHGTRRFLFTFFATGLAGSLASVLWSAYGLHPDWRRWSIGASGAIFGLLGGLISFLLRRRDRLTPAAKSLLSQLLFWAGVNIYLGLSIARIDNTAHLGGLVAGLLIGLALREPEQAPPPPPLPAYPPGFG